MTGFHDVYHERWILLESNQLRATNPHAPSESIEAGREVSSRPAWEGFYQE